MKIEKNTMSRQQIYKTKTWDRIRKYIWIKQKCICNRCHRPVYVSGISEWLPIDKRLKGIVHHKEYLDDTNYTDINISYNEDNLEGICIDCHNKEHFKSKVIRDDVMFDEYGNLIPR